MLANNPIAPSAPSDEKTHCIPSQIRETSKSGGANPSYQVSRGQSLSRKVESPSFSKSQHPPKTSQSALPPDRVIVTAHYEIKAEESDDDDLIYPEASSSKILHPRVEDEEDDEFEVPNAKRKRVLIRKQSIRRIDDDGVQKQDGADADEVYHQVEGRTRLRNGNGQEDFDDMAIGAEVRVLNQSAASTKFVR